MDRDPIEQEMLAEHHANKGENAAQVLDGLRGRLKHLSHLITDGKGGTISDAEIQDLFEGFFVAIPRFDAQRYEEQFRLSRNGLLLQPAFFLLKCWNSIAEEARRLDVEVLLKPYKDHLRQVLDSMAVVARQTQHLATVFDQEWFTEVHRLIDVYDGVESFGTNTHTAFIGFLQEIREGGNLLSRLDTAYGAIAQVAGRQRIKTLRKKLGDFSRPLTDYLGTVFEILVLGPCAEAGWLKEYEPKVGRRHAEGLVVVNGVRLLLEATVVTSGRELVGFQAISLEEGANKTLMKILDKAQQLEAAADPILLFLSPHLSRLPQEIKRGIAEAFLQDGCRSIAGVVVSDSYCVHRLRVGWNSLGHPVPQTVQDELSRLYQFQRLNLDNPWSDD